MSKLANRDGVLLVDRSGSMSESDTLSGQTRWKEAAETAVAFARELGKHDEDGIDLHTFNHAMTSYPSTTAEKVKAVFEEKGPNGSTMLAQPLKTIFANYLAKKAKGEAKANGELLVVITDGQPGDENDVAKAIVDFTHKLDNGDDEYGILFLQIGKDAQASKFLKKLDDDLQSMGAKFDIVDTKTMEELDGISMEAALMAALDD